MSEDETPDMGEALNEAATALANVFDYLQVLAEQAKGYREYLEANGWSPTIAEQLAAMYLMNLTNQAMTGSEA